MLIVEIMVIVYQKIVKNYYINNKKQIFQLNIKIFIKIFFNFILLLFLLKLNMIKTFHSHKSLLINNTEYSNNF